MHGVDNPIVRGTVLERTQWEPANRQWRSTPSIGTSSNSGHVAIESNAEKRPENFSPGSIWRGLRLLDFTSELVLHVGHPTSAFLQRLVIPAAVSDLALSRRHKPMVPKALQLDNGLRRTRTGRTNHRHHI